jgi:hypothetical protein
MGVVFLRHDSEMIKLPDHSKERMTCAIEMPGYYCLLLLDGGYLAAGNGVYDNHSVDGQIFILEAPVFP